MCNTLRSFGAQNRRNFRRAAIAAGLEANRRAHLDLLYPERVEGRKKEAEQGHEPAGATTAMPPFAAAVAEAYRS